MEDSIPEGIFRLSEPGRRREGDLLVAVHPWYRHSLRVLQRIDYRVAEVQNAFPLPQKNSDYLGNITALFNSHAGPLFVFQEMDGFNPALDRLLTTPSILEESYMALTEIGGLAPALGTKDEWVAFLKSFDKNVLLCGGYLHSLIKPRGTDGCLDIVYSWLKDEGINARFVDGCCFTPELDLKG